jgi:TRAP-type C4-dicarboxylate transport system substrate-binding protein
MNTRKIVFACMCMVALCTAVRAESETVVIKLATVAPTGSTWHEYLQRLDAQWRQASAGKVRLKIYAGTLGDEEDIMRRVRIGQIDAATVTTAGLSTIDEATKALHIPLAFASYEELDYVQSGIAASLEQALRKKGIVVLNWGDAGWVRFFTGSPVQRPDDLKKEKLFVWSAGGATEVEQIWKKLGFNPIPLSVVDIIPALQTGMITAYQAPPIAALANQWFALSGSMTNLRWAPLTGATVIAARTWSKIPPELRPELARIAEEAGEWLRERVRRLEHDAIAAMTKRGVQVVDVTPEAYQEWQQLIKSVHSEIRGKIVPARYFDEVLRLRDEYRAAHAVAGETGHQ